MIDLQRGRALQQEAFKERNLSVIAEHNASITWKGRWHTWLIQNGPELLDEIERLRTEGLRSKEKRGEVFNFQTRLQILTILWKDVEEKGTPEALSRFEEALLQHQSLTRE